ncbi:MAG: hypothetical protein ACRDRJ_00675 [Streptosporangiaceae bacterium]
MSYPPPAQPPPSGYPPYYGPPPCPPRNDVASDVASGLMIGFGAFVAALGALGWYLFHVSAAECSNTLVSAFDQAQCVHDGTMYDLSMAGLVSGGLVFVAGIVVHFVRR